MGEEFYNEGDVQNSDIYFGGAWLSDAREVIEELSVDEDKCARVRFYSDRLIVGSVQAGGRGGSLFTET